MRELLEQVSAKALLLNDFNFSEELRQSGWLGATPASSEEIQETEDRLKIKLPDDYVEFLKTSNGFPATSGISPSFLPVGQIDYVRVLNNDLVELWKQHEELKHEAADLEASILVGGLNEEQQFMLIPPGVNYSGWRYVVWASWNPGDEGFTTLRDYFESTLAFLKEQTAS